MLGTIGGLSDPIRQAATRRFDRAADIVAGARSGGRLDIDALARTVQSDTGANARLTRQAVEAQLTPVERGQLAARLAPSTSIPTLVADVAQITLDIVGIVEPTPFADLANAAISLGRGDGVGAALSAAGAVPYVGDLAKAGKLGRWAQTVSRAVDAALASPAAMRLLHQPLARLGQAIGAIPAGVMDRLPASAQETLRGLKSQIDRVATPVAREVNTALAATARRLGIPEERLVAVRDAPRGSRPAASTYMTAAQRATHLAAFDDGIVRITRRDSLSAHGTLGPSGGFVTSAREYAAIAREAGGDLRVIERRLGLDPGQLGDANTLVALIRREDAPSLRLPSGNEGGANDRWVPGGYTSGLTAEAVMDFPRGLPFREIKP